MGEKKCIGISVPCYNEAQNVVPMAEGLVRLFEEDFPQYDYVVQFIDNCSTDGTRELLRGICKKHPKVRAILNVKNFPATSGYYGLLQAGGDCTIAIPCDFQVPLDTIPQMIAEWENGSKIVALVKKSSEEKKGMWGIRQLYYKLANKFSDVEIIRNFTGCGLFDKDFLDICRSIKDPAVSFMQQVSTYGYNMVKLPYVHANRKSGKSKNSLWQLLNLAVTRFTNASTLGPRIATIFGFLAAVICILVGLVYLVLKLMFWDMFPAGTAPMLIGMFFLGAIQLFFIGLVGEYVVKANIRLMNQPLVVEEERINFD